MYIFFVFVYKNTHKSTSIYWSIYRRGLQNTSTESLLRGKVSSTSVLHMAPKNDGEALVILEFWRMLSAPLLPSLPGPL